MMGKVRVKKVSGSQQRDNTDKWWGSEISYNPNLDDAKITFASSKLEEANRLIANLELPKFDKDGNYIP